MPNATKKASGRRREKMIGVHVTDAEYERLRELAFEARLSIAAYVRARLLEPKKAK